MGLRSRLGGLRRKVVLIQSRPTLWVPSRSRGLLAFPEDFVVCAMFSRGFGGGEKRRRWSE